VGGYLFDYQDGQGVSGPSPDGAATIYSNQIQTGTRAAENVLRL